MGSVSDAVGKAVSREMDETAGPVWVDASTFMFFETGELHLHRDGSHNLRAFPYKIIGEDEHSAFARVESPLSRTRPKVTMH